MEGDDVHLIFVFVHPAHETRYAAVPAILRQRFPGAQVIGCSATGVSGNSREIEDGACIAVMGGHLPGVEITPFATELPSDGLSEEDWRRVIGVDPLPQPALILLPDPFSVPTDQILRSLDRAYPRSVKVGGLASGGREAGENVLFGGEFMYREGLVGVALVGDIRVDTVVAQGARAVGPRLAITGGRENLVTSLDGRPVLDVLTEVFEDVSDDDRALFERSPMVGYADDYEALPEEMLTRAIMGVHRTNGVMAVGFQVRVGDFLQFHVRDHMTAHHDLQSQLKRLSRGEPYAGALLFTCLGRGLRFFGEPDHDARALQAGVGPLPSIGFLGNGEIGPVRGRTHLHGYTACIALFRSMGWN